MNVIKSSLSCTIESWRKKLKTELKAELKAELKTELKTGANKKKSAIYFDEYNI